MDLKQLAAQYKNELFEMYFLSGCIARKTLSQGGYYTCLNRRGEVFDTDKFVWLQGVKFGYFPCFIIKWKKQKEWLDCAVQGGEFLKKHGHDGNYNWYFSLDRKGLLWWNPIISSLIHLLRWPSGNLA